MQTRTRRCSPAFILVIAGSTQALAIGPHGPAVDLSTLNGANGFVMDGIVTRDRNGQSVSAAGDVNGDGIDDFIIGAHGASPNGVSNAGESYVVFGGAGIGASGTLDLAALNGTNGFVCNGIDVADVSGVSAAAAGDVNGDGIDDLIIGAHLADPNGDKTGESYVVFGAVGIGAGGSIELSALNGTNGFVCNGIDVEDQSGVCVASAGDVNGDGIDDLIIGAYGADPNGGESGESYVVFGAANVGSSGSIELSALNGTNGFVCNGIDANDRSGRSVSSAGDFNGDGIGDLVIGASDADPNGASSAGECYVVFGAVGLGSSGAIELSALNGTNGFVCNGIDALDQSGYAVAAAGDVNGDGFGDIIIGAYYADSNGMNSSGESYVVFGGAGVGAGGAFELSSLNGLNGFVCGGVNAYDNCGISVDAAGDVNGDGIDDLIIGANQASPNGVSQAGESYVVFGNDSLGAWGGPFPLGHLRATNGDYGFAIGGIVNANSTGSSVSAAGDINDDGFGDLVIGASRASTNGFLSGASYIVFGNGAATNLPADINGDGIVDAADLGILIGSFGQTAP